MGNICNTPPWSFLMTLLFLCGSILPVPARLTETGIAMQEAAKPSHEREIDGAGQAPERDGTEHYRERLTAEYSKKVNRVIDHYVRAQEAFFGEEYQQALQEINSALNLTETADLLAFKGAIYYGMGQHAEAFKAFSRAFSLDASLPVPRIQGLHRWLTDNNLIP